MAPTSANYVFLPWVRQGAASGIQTPDMSANQAGVVAVSVKLAVNNTPPEIERQVRLYGPGDVTGIDRLQVIRTEPRHLATDFEPNYFPAIEFDRPDFPWLFTPATANDAGKLRPWLCLVVVRKQEGVTLRVDHTLPLPVLDIKAPARPELELPDLTESWAWAHAQVTGSSLNQASLESSLAGNPALTLSRLLCPRRLDPMTEYLACVVPTFELGRKAGLGLPIQRDDTRNEEKELMPAWTRGQQPLDAVTLPVYFHWEFRTGTGGDFEALVKLLTARDLRETPKVGKRLVDISQPDFNVTLPSGTTLELEGALRVLNATTAEWPEVTRAPFQVELKKILDAPWQATQNDEDKDPVVAPPIYGCWQAARHTINVTPVPPDSLTWLDELNLDPRHRAVAALGTQVVQTQQEELMAAAWEQLGEIDRINQLRRQAQLARAVNGVYYTRHLSRFSDETLLKVFGVAQSRVIVETTDINNVTTRELLSKKISNSVIPDRVVSAPMRRLTSPRSKVSARFQPVGAAPIAIVARLNTVTPIVAFRANDAALISINLVTNRAAGLAAQLNQTVRFERTITALDTAPPLGDFSIVPEGQVRSLLDFKRGLQDSPDAAAFRKAAKDHQAHMAKVFTPPTDSLPPTKLTVSRDALLQSVIPGITLKKRVQASLLLSSDVVETDDPLEQVMDAPEFPQPMYEALRDLSQDFLLPGLEHIAANTVTLLGTNPNFVESFLVGLNDEMSHELLWRNYPTDQRGTYFRQFWDTSVNNDEPDIETINKWGDLQLGQNSPNTSGKLVLLIRGELLRRYPNSVIYAVAAVPKDGRLTLSKKPEGERHPLFRGSLKPDVTFLGFDLTEAQAKGEAPNDPNGWFFVIQQQPTEPCFGMDVADFAKDPPAITTTWNELSWRHMANSEEELKALSHVSIDSIKSVVPNIDTQKIDNATWGKNSSHLAYITLQRPMRIAIHAREMIKKI